MARQLELFQSYRAVWLRTLAQSVWHHRWFGWVMIIGFSAWYTWWGYHIPSPAKAATLLAVIAAIMAYRGEPEGFEKLFWTIVLFAFLFMELSAIDHKEKIDEETRQESRIEEAKAFEKIGQGIQKSIDQSDSQFRQTVAQQSQHFDATMKESRMNVDEITGGDSYVIVYPDLTPRKEPKFPMFVRLCTKCQYSISNAAVHMTDEPDSNLDAPLIYQGNVDPGIALGLAAITIHPALKGESVYKIFVAARNKPTMEILKVRFNTDAQQWECSWHIEREVKLPRYNAQSHMAEGQVMKVLEDSPWIGNHMTPVNPAKTTVVH